MVKSKSAPKAIPLRKPTQQELEVAFSKKIHLRAWVWVIVSLLLFNLLTGCLSYGVMTVWCMRLPVTASKFAGGHSYSVPGQTGYGPNMFAQYYCTEKDAQNAGFYKAAGR